uniref:phosphoenolpyruvate carboxykinase (ATP) n=1 Tax=Leersia perrieri TaxID=77586 RepID=A0A0D9UZY5_9ORYZ
MAGARSLLLRHIRMAVSPSSSSSSAASLRPAAALREALWGRRWMSSEEAKGRSSTRHRQGRQELPEDRRHRQENLSAIPLHVRGNVTSGNPDVSRAQFAKLLKLVTFHLSSISSLYVQDGAVGSSMVCDAKVRVISDNPSAVMLLSNILWRTPDRAISHDTCPLTIYVANSIRLLCFGGSAVMLFAPVDVIKSSGLEDVLVSTDSGVVVSSNGSSVLFPTKAREPNLLAKPTTAIIVSLDSTDALPTVSKLSPGQAAYHFLAGYHDEWISSFQTLSNTGKELRRLIEAILLNNLPDCNHEDTKVGELKGKYKSFLSGKFGKYLPMEFSF